MAKSAEVNTAWEVEIKKVLDAIFENCSNISLEDLETLRILSEKKINE